jgi:peptidoglycan/LPS O-acetylase OafA/YrhL
MRRRVRRIVPPYLGSLALAAVVKLATSADLFNGSRSLSRPWFWLSNLSLTQWSYLTTRWLQNGDGLAAPWFNPMLLLGVHWSLNYEEQFYLLCGLILVFHRKMRTVVLVAAFTAGVAFFNILWPGRITGLFVDYWLQFFCGVLVYLRLCRSRSRGTARALDALLIGGAIVLLICALRRGDFPLLPNQLQFHGQLAVCAVYALLLIALRRYDEAASASLPMRALRFFGKFSYSIYLVHRPMLDALEPVSQSLQSRLGWTAADVWTFGAVLVSAYAFYRVFEKPFLNPSLAFSVQRRRSPAVLFLP